MRQNNLINIYIYIKISKLQLLTKIASNYSLPGFPCRVAIIRNIVTILSEGFSEVVYFIRNVLRELGQNLYVQYNNYGEMG